ncbi:mechanosensitive ion channel family protein, partial [bacterium]|nr:mechanosensitive ion channel family protein [bacterium]
SVSFCSSDLLTQLSKINILNDYLSQKETELATQSSEHPINGRRQTNLGIFRAYIEAYLRQNNQISQSLTFLVRHLQPTENGLPIEIYVFSTNKEWIAYEGIQADIMDHLLAALPEFDLRVFQNPTGADFRKLGS